MELLQTVPAKAPAKKKGTNRSIALPDASCKVRNTSLSSSLQRLSLLLSLLPLLSHAARLAPVLIAQFVQAIIGDAVSPVRPIFLFVLASALWPLDGDGMLALRDPEIPPCIAVEKTPADR